MISQSPTLESLSLGNSLSSLEKKSPKRIWEVDFARGTFIILVILFHIGWDFAALPSFFSNWNAMSSTYPGFAKFVTDINGMLFSRQMNVWVNVFSGCFLFLTGLSCSLSRSNTKRSLKILFVAGLITLFTYLATQIMGQDMVIVFGILHCIGLSLFLYSLVELLGHYLHFNIDPWPVFLLGAGMLGYGWYLQYFTNPVYYGFDELNGLNYLKIVLGFAYNYNDDFALLPNMGKVLVGIAVGKWLYGGKRGKKSVLPKLDGFWNKPICFLGRHTFLVYIVHQPIVLAILVPIILSMGYTIG